MHPGTSGHEKAEEGCVQILREEDWGREAFQRPGGVAHGGLSMNLMTLLSEISVPQTSDNIIQPL